MEHRSCKNKKTIGTFSLTPIAQGFFLILDTLEANVFAKVEIVFKGLLPSWTFCNKCLIDVAPVL